MNVWTQRLRAPLRDALADRRFERVERSHSGDWQAQDEVGDWWCLEEGRFRHRGMDQDPRLARVGAAMQAWREEGYELRCLAYRRGRRAVFLRGRKMESDIAKAYAKDRQILLRWNVLQGAAGLRVPRVLSYDEERKILYTEVLGGRSLHAKWWSGEAGPEDADVLVGVLSGLAHQEVDPRLPAHRVADEIALLEAKAAQLRDALEDVPAGVQQAVEASVAGLQRLGEVERVVAHRDLHDKQLLVEGSHFGLIDLDVLAAAPGGLDAGNILGHLRLRALEGVVVDWEWLARRVVEADHPWSEVEVLRPWIAATLCRLAMIYSLREHRAGLLEQLAADALEVCCGGPGPWQRVLS